MIGYLFRNKQTPIIDSELTWMVDSQRDMKTNDSPIYISFGMG